MDPLSGAANIIAIAGLACKTCQALVSFFHGIAKAREDILQFCKILRSLDSTLQCIKSLCIDTPTEQYLTQNFITCLKECFSELEHANGKCAKAQVLMRKGKMQSSWARMKWYLSAEYWLEDFLSHIQTYHMVFSLELSTVQTQVNHPDIMTIATSSNICQEIVTIKQIRQIFFGETRLSEAPLVWRKIRESH